MVTDVVNWKADSSISPMLTLFPRHRTDSRRARTLAGTAQHCKEKAGLEGKHRESATLHWLPLRDVCVS